MLNTDSKYAHENDKKNGFTDILFWCYISLVFSRYCICEVLRLIINNDFSMYKVPLLGMLY